MSLTCISCDTTSSICWVCCSRSVGELAWRRILSLSRNLLMVRVLLILKPSLWRIGRISRSLNLTWKIRVFKWEWSASFSVEGSGSLCTPYWRRRLWTVRALTVNEWSEFSWEQIPSTVVLLLKREVICSLKGLRSIDGRILEVNVGREEEVWGIVVYCLLFTAPLDVYS